VAVHRRLVYSLGERHIQQEITGDPIYVVHWQGFGANLLPLGTKALFRGMNGTLGELGSVAWLMKQKKLLGNSVT
jgi:hypothetical protein